MLLAYGEAVECELPRSRRRPLLQSVRYEQGAMVRLLLQHGADPLAVEDHDGAMLREYEYPPASRVVNAVPAIIRVPTWVYALLRRDLGVLQALNDSGRSLRARDDDEPSLSDAVGRAGVLAVALCGPGASSRKDL